MYRNWSQLRASSHEPGCRPDSARFPRFRLVFFDVFTWKGGLARFPKISVIKRAGNFAIWTLSLVAGVKAGWILAVRMASSCIACYIFHVIRWERLAHQLGFPFSKSSCFNFRTLHVPNGTVVWGRGGESPHGLGGGDVWHFRFLHISDNAPYLAPKILHNSFVFHFSWVLQPSEEKLRTMHLIKRMRRLFEATRLQQYPGYQRFSGTAETILKW